VSDAVASWLAARAPQWRALAATAAGARRAARGSVEAAQQLLDGYRSLARDLATARRQLPGSSVTRALESVYGSFHALINRAPRNGWQSVKHLLRVDVPDVVHTLRPHILWVALLFALSTGAGWWLVLSYPELTSLFASEEMIEHVERGQLWTEGMLNVAPSSVVSVRIFSNNIAVSVFALCAGVFYGLGTFYLIALNGLMLGAVFAFTHQHGLDGALFRFVIAHGTVELSLICLAGAAGMAIGESIARPRGASRLESFQECTARVAKLLPLMGLLLVGCGLIEGFISPDPGFPLASRVVIGGCYFGVMCAALTGRLFGAPRRA
jgi:uncharacterized membrane protein SpoIIM required for sporulation